MSRPSNAASRPGGLDEQGHTAGDPGSSVTEIHSNTPEAAPRPAASGSIAVRRDALAGALHEVSNALTVVLGWLDAAAQTDDPAKLRGALQVARDHASRGRQIARHAIGAEDDSPTEVRGAAGLARFAAMSVRPRALGRSVQVEVTLLPEPDVALDDEAPALQVLTNLLLNAIDFSPPGGRVEVSVTSDPQSVIFAISDEGPGIPEERRVTLFAEPVSTRRGGAGIGLPHSRGLAQQHGGDLRLVPSPVGARFELQWPRTRMVVPRSEIPEGSNLRVLMGARVLVVEDDAAIGSLLELSLEAKGAEVLLVSGADDLARMLGGRPVIDAALLDLSPLRERLVGWLDEIRRHAPGAPLVLVSGHPNGIPEEVDGRFSAWVRKPFEMSELLHLLGGLLAERPDAP